MQQAGDLGAMRSPERCKLGLACPRQTRESSLLPETWSGVWPKEGSPHPAPAPREATASMVHSLLQHGQHWNIASTHCHLSPVELYRGKDAWVKCTLPQNMSASLPCTPTFQTETICQPELHHGLRFVNRDQLPCPASSTLSLVVLLLPQTALSPMGTYMIGQQG